MFLPVTVSREHVLITGIDATLVSIVTVLALYFRGRKDKKSWRRNIHPPLFTLLPHKISGITRQREQEKMIKRNGIKLSKNRIMRATL